MSDNARRILVVDDDPDIVLVLESLLEDVGYTVSKVERFDELDHLGEGVLPDLIVLDLYLSGKDGREIARRMKAQETTRHIPILMLSAHPTAPQQAQAAGADAFLAKPFDLDELVRTIGAFFA